MELSWSTFLLEIINFLVLVWILKRFLYKPVLNVIAQRRSGIEAQLDEAQHLHNEAEALKGQYEGRLAEWDRERQQARDSLVQELDEERQRQLQALQTQLSQEREKADVVNERRRNEALRETEHRALQQASEFATRLLSQAAGPELEARLVDMVIQQLAELGSEQTTALQAQWGEPLTAITVSSAYPLSTEQQQALQSRLASITGLSSPLQFKQEPALLAGLSITVGAWVLQANLRDELRGFAEFAHVAR